MKTPQHSDPQTDIAAPLFPGSKASLFATLQAMTAQDGQARRFSAGHLGLTVLCAAGVSQVPQDIWHP